MQANQLQNRVPWHVLTSLQLPPPQCIPSLLCNSIPLNKEEQHHSILLVNTIPRLLHIVIHDTLQCCWSFPKNIVSFCWNSDPLDKHFPRNQSVLVATTDGDIWNIPLSIPESGSSSASINPAKNDSLHNDPHQPIVPIKILDSDDEVEEVELWNDEDGLLDSVDMSESHLPSMKRPRTDSSANPCFVANETPGLCLKVNPTAHLVGQENNLTKIAFLSNKLLIFRRDDNPIFWSSEQHFKPGTPVSTTALLNISHPLVTCWVSLQQKVLLGTKSGDLYIVEESNTHLEKTVKANKIHIHIKGGVFSLLLCPCSKGNQSEYLIAISSYGDITVLPMKLLLDTKSGDVVTKTTINTPLHYAFVAGDSLYLASRESRVFRLDLSSLESIINSQVETLNLPAMHVFIPILHDQDCSDVSGYYGLNYHGQILRFKADISRAGQPKVARDARDNISETIRILDKLSEQAKKLEIECQMDNRRIASYNRLINTLQKSVLSSGNEPFSITEPPIDVCYTAIVQRLAKGFNGVRSYYLRLTLTSNLNIDWNEGWSVAINIARSIRKCIHRSESLPTRQQNIVTSIAELSQHTPWTQDIEIEIDNFCLPITIKIGLQYNDTTKTSRPKLGTYFPVESFEMDSIHFSEPIRDQSKQNPAYYAHAIGTSLDSMKNKEENSESLADFRILSSNAKDDPCKDCINAILTPLTFSVNTSEIKITQCLPILLGDGISSNQLQAMVQSSTRASLSIPEDCLSKPRYLRKASNLVQNDASLVWIMLDVKEGLGSLAEATLEIKGSDRARVSSVYYAIQRRIDEIF